MKKVTYYDEKGICKQAWISDEQSYETTPLSDGICIGTIVGAFILILKIIVPLL